MACFTILEAYQLGYDSPETVKLGSACILVELHHRSKSETGDLPGGISKKIHFAISEVSHQLYITKILLRVTERLPGFHQGTLLDTSTEAGANRLHVAAAVIGALEKTNDKTSDRFKEHVCHDNIPITLFGLLYGLVTSETDRHLLSALDLYIAIVSKTEQEVNFLFKNGDQMAGGGPREKAPHEEAFQQTPPDGAQPQEASDPYTYKHLCTHTFSSHPPL
ncbi:hypothetical protein NLG97_g5906 [Lecanicillium saksenae]|uniref:Uncharacterized protein n=1 Tax=Lecanicillium saksenae TaxID=468837 RepID=A0ACC1QRA7_9HYPO|nr:hypothetical protein NLG97_g5906 [Lecanicillium saksenae]